jgi:hypothetical protein
MPRGGARQGTPGKGYSNRTDLMASMKPPAPGQVNPTAAGGMTAAPQRPQQGAPSGMPMPSPDDTPMLNDPTAYPDEPVTAGLPVGPGPGPTNNLMQETQQMKRYLPLIQPFLDRPDVPDSVRSLYRYIRGS